jgi:hypothetical protein
MQLLSRIACAAMIELFTSFRTGVTVTWPYRLSDVCEVTFILYDGQENMPWTAL